ncbi:hypothetical protein BRD00_14800 [Halobacteriales archaeon QS_8_69_26]|nr:MAG: hypothetical protein BRD00_14800 [Halobacteriales archaeon QS_8_69_26]
MYPRPLYVALLALGTTALQFAAAFNEGPLLYLAFVVALVLGVVVFYQGETRVVAGPIFSNFVMAAFLGTAGCVVLTAGLLMYVLAVPWDLALWQGALFVWDVAIGIDFTMVTGFFVVGVVDAMY